MVEIDRKASSQGTIFIKSTLDKPNVELIINAVATILHSQMLEVTLRMLKYPIGSKSREGYPSWK